MRKLYITEGNPVISVDTKKNELIGNQLRNGKIVTTETIAVFDHDFPSIAESVAIPHTIYDMVQNKAYVTIGTSRDTNGFVCDSICQWWNNHGKLLYLTATSILMLMDGGGNKWVIIANPRCAIKLISVLGNSQKITPANFRHTTL